MNHLRALTLFLSATTVFAQNWPQFRGPNASGVADGMNVPANWDAPAGKNLAWRTPIPGIAVSSPVVWGDKVFVTTAISGDPKAGFRHGLYGDVEPVKDDTKHTWKVYCLDRNTGKILWEQTSYEGVPKTKRHPKSSQASATPAADGRHLAVWFGSEGLYVYDFNGKLLWKKDLGTLNAGWFFDPDFEWGIASSPVIYDGKVIVQVDIQKGSYLAAFDVKSGKEIYRIQRDEIPSWGTPTVYETKEGARLVTNGTKGVRGYDVKTGKEVWSFLGNNSEITATTPFVAHDLIFIGNGYPPVQPIIAIRTSAKGDISLKEKQETNEHVAWSKMRGGPYLPTMIVYGDILYSCSNNGILTAYNAKTGERIYQQRIGKGGAYSAAPIASDGKLYFTSEDGDINVVKAGPTYELLGANPIGEVLMATPAITKDMFIVRSMANVYGIKATN
ncbi:MAG: PQQ-binding-like beta-propeller repeat protein [Bryobacteraceae bacterium]|nr:PQQ-binding-like beta-propeller repeat protein [Bryobacteraceae bacterium]